MKQTTCIQEPETVSSPHSPNDEQDPILWITETIMVNGQPRTIIFPPDSEQLDEQ